MRPEPSVTAPVFPPSTPRPHHPVAGCSGTDRADVMAGPPRIPPHCGVSDNTQRARLDVHHAKVKIRIRECDRKAHSQRHYPPPTPVFRTFHLLPLEPPLHLLRPFFQSSLLDHSTLLTRPCPYSTSQRPTVEILNTILPTDFLHPPYSPYTPTDLPPIQRYRSIRVRSQFSRFARIVIREKEETPLIDRFE